MVVDVSDAASVINGRGADGQLGRRPLVLHLVGDRHPTDPDQRDRRFQTTRMLDRAAMDGDQSQPKVLIEGLSRDIVVGGDQPESAAPLHRRGNQGATDPCACLKGIERNDLECIAMDTIGEASNTLAAALSNNRREFFGMMDFSPGHYDSSPAFTDQIRDPESVGDVSITNGQVGSMHFERVCPSQGIRGGQVTILVRSPSSDSGSSITHYRRRTRSPRGRWLDSRTPTDIHPGH